jgi:hypothetical protein
MPAHISQMHKPTKRELAQLARRTKLWQDKNKANA